MDAVTANIYSRRESNARSYCRSFPPVFQSSMGAEVWDVDGRRYIDFLAGAGALNYGHNPLSLRKPLIEYIEGGGITQGLDLHTTAKSDFLTKFDNIILAPRSMKHRVMFTGPTGTNAVEAAIKLARKATDRGRIAAFTNAFHGMSAGALALTGSRYHRMAGDVSHAAVDRYPYDGYLGPNVDTIALIEHYINDPSSGFEPPAAFLVECVQGEGGLNVATDGWLQRLEALARQLGSLLIVDDIQAGCGRTGHFFSFESSGIQPDLICLSKSLSGYGLPMAVVLVSPEYDVLGPGQHNGTFRGNNLAFVTASAALDYWCDNDFAEAVQSNILRFHSSLSHLTARLGDGFSVKGKGLMVGISCRDDKLANAISKNAFARNLIVELCGPKDEVVKCLPPLNIDSDVAEEGLSILEAAVLDVCGL